jgi:hypothetical protein
VSTTYHLWDNQDFLGLPIKTLQALGRLALCKSKCLCATRSRLGKDAFCLLDGRAGLWVAGGQALAIPVNGGIAARVENMQN